MVNRYNISINYKLKPYKMTLGSKRRLQLSSGGNLSMDETSTGTTGVEVGLVFIF
jgi:rhamnose utilization protein RhaD (predicted bifunctional aldolase and dehydrogenase)